MPDAGPDARPRSVASALSELGDIGEADAPLGALTTYRVGGRAAVLARPRSVADLERVVAARRASGLPLLVVGRGSNLLIADRGFEGLAVSTTELAADLTIDERAATVEAGSAVLLPVLARQTARAALTGLEWAVGVPGTVGGAVRMNAGGHGSDIAASILDAVLFDLDSGSSGTVAAADLGLRFRSSAVTSDQLVVSARFQLRPGDRARAERTISEIVSWRRENQPGGQNAGSVFVNPVPGEVSAGFLIDELGLRGRRLGTAMVSEKHANFIQADDGGSADDVRELIEAIRDEVATATGFELRSEIRLIGFDGDSDG